MSFRCKAALGRPLKFLYDIVHPADVHFFRHLIDFQQKRGDAVLVTSRYKDLTIPLLQAFGIEHRAITRKGCGLGGLMLELALRDGRLLRAARDFAPDVVIANNSPSAAHVGRWLGVPSVVFDDTEIHRLNRLLYLPAVTEVHSPDCYRGRVGSKHRLYPSYHPLAYLHPDQFEADPGVLRDLDIVPERRRVLVRFVENNASHDFGVEGLSDTAKRDLIAGLGRWADVLISAESQLPPDLAAMSSPVPVDALHHLIAFSELLVADSATMCAEAAVLGVPAIYIDDRGRGYTDELSERYGLCFRFSANATRDALETAVAILRGDRPKAAFRAAHARLMAEKINPLPHQIDTLDRLASSQSGRSRI
ncbi:DUF354 domain-containing protein [uncultured Thiohalocapsa sp.]|uniref:DUF354 domain-containing protein n=1 Tax=uncultured Thiohalocapsa sp. TaxID=768990 RepID=UPI0026013167|nr:DUF354 domain-containing protein [uncultured Thiohalocapsa sp.]